MNRVYVAGPYSSAEYVRGLHERLRGAGFEPTSSWANTASGAESLLALPIETRSAIKKQNCDDLRSADVCIVIDRDGTGHETYCELARAEEWGKDVYFVGRPMLTAVCPPVLWCRGIEDVIALMIATKRSKEVA